MRDKPARPLLFLLLGLAVIGALGWLVNSTTPTTSTIVSFFLLLFVSLFFLTAFLLNNRRFAVLVGLWSVIALMLRLLGLRSPLYLFLLLVVLVSLELTWRKR